MPRVSSYLAFPSLPGDPAVYFCCTFPGVASAGRYPAPCRTVLGLSSPESGAVVCLTRKLDLYFNGASTSAYRILPQFSHSTTASLSAIFFSTTMGSDMLQPPHLLLMTFATGRA